MTKTTTTCDMCGSEIPHVRPEEIRKVLRIRATEYINEVEKSNADFCSRSCLSEYLKPKTETTP